MTSFLLSCIVSSCPRSHISSIFLSPMLPFDEKERKYMYTSKMYFAMNKEGEYICIYGNKTFWFWAVRAL